jgi:hypothetical protein
MKKIIRLTESDLTRIVKRVIMEQNVSEKRRIFFDNLAKKISNKLVGKKLYFGQIGVLSDSSITINKYNDRNHAINLEGQNVDELNLFFNVTRDKEDLYPNEKKGTRIWKGLLNITAKFENGKISQNPEVILYLDEGGKVYFEREMTPEKPWTWDMVGGSTIWSEALKGNNM